MEYYVDATNGNDSNSGIKGHDLVINAWQTMAKVNKTSFKPGDKIRLKCGEIWREPLIVSSSGSVSKPITYTSYGDNCDPLDSSTMPVINASVEVKTRWKRYSGNIFVVKFKLPVKQLFVNSQYLKLAQHPDNDYMTIDVDSGVRDYLIDYELADSLPANCDNNLKGSGIHIRTEPWFIEDREVKAYDYNEKDKRYELVLTNKTARPISSGYGYYLDNKLCMLDQPGEWYYDDRTQELYVWLPDGSDPGHADISYKIEASIYDFGIYASFSAYILIDNIRVENAAVNGINFNDSPGFTVRKSVIANSGHKGIYAHESPNGHIVETHVMNSSKEGIYLKRSEGALIIGNHVENSGTIGSPTFQYGAITASNNTVIKNNTVFNSAYHGIAFVRETTVENNIIENPCLVLNDCGGIYTWSGNVQDIAYNSKVVGNIIINALGNHEGTSSLISSASGIYLDDLSNGIDVLNNTVVNASLYGISLHNTYNIIVNGNTLYGNKRSQLALIESGNWRFANSMRGNNIINNIMFPLNPNAPIYMRGEFGDTDFGGFTSNYYSSLYSNRIVHEVNRDCYDNKGDNDPNNDRKGPSVHHSYRLHDWQQQHRMDSYGNLVSKDSNTIQSKHMSELPDRVISSKSNTLVISSTFDIDRSSWSPVNSAVTEWIEDCNNSGGCLKFSSSKNLCNSHLQSEKLLLEKDKSFMVKFRAMSNEFYQSLRVVVRSSDYKKYFLDETIVLDDIWRTFTFNFKINKNEKDIRLDYFAPPKQIIYFDDISIMEVKTEYIGPNNVEKTHTRILINKSAQNPPEPIYCPDYISNDNIECRKYIDLYGEPVNWPLTLNPFSSKIIVRDNN